MFTITIDRQKRAIDWAEINQLRKDILWIFDENTGQLNASFVPDYSFKSKYWEYLTLDSEEQIADIDFYKEGVLIIILCMTVEYMDTSSGNQEIFGGTEISEIVNYIEAFNPTNQDQNKLKALVLLGLNIAASMTQSDLLNTDGYQNKDLDNFYSQLKWVDTTFIRGYFNSKTK
jgi:hypothetical protein